MAKKHSEITDIDQVIEKIDSVLALKLRTRNRKNREQNEIENYAALFEIHDMVDNEFSVENGLKEVKRILKEIKSSRTMKSDSYAVIIRLFEECVLCPIREYVEEYNNGIKRIGEAHPNQFRRSYRTAGGDHVQMGHDEVRIIAMSQFGVKFPLIVQAEELLTILTAIQDDINQLSHGNHIKGSKQEQRKNKDKYTKTKAELSTFIGLSNTVTQLGNIILPSSKNYLAEVGSALESDNIERAYNLTEGQLERKYTTEQTKNLHHILAELDTMKKAAHAR